MNNKIIALILAIILLPTVFFSWSVHSNLKTPAVQAIIINFDKSASASQFAHILKENNLISSPKLFLSVIRFKGLSHKLKAGVYEVKPGETALQILQRVVAGDVLVKNFTIIAGTTQAKIDKDLQAANYLQYQADDWNMLQDGHLNAEGQVLADTYQYRGGSSGKTLLENAHQNLQTYLTNAWNNRAADLPFKSAYELLIAASIIEKESAHADERKLIAGVLVNRIKMGMPLQMDPTVIYGLKEAYTGKLSHNDLLVDSPYNTYRYRGLPPTPIATVGKEAIDAAAHPTVSKYLYFVAKGDGRHQFSETYLQQRQAISQYKHKDS
ncbi:MAG: endolytic transglycosylase MltG [Legionella sp.]|jgi:UPF0755 protein